MTDQTPNPDDLANLLGGAAPDLGGLLEQAQQMMQSATAAADEVVEGAASGGLGKVEVDGHFYSVAYQLVGKELEARYTSSTVELLHAEKRVACHVRSHQRGGHTTLREHMPAAHRGYAEQTPQTLLAWAETIGPATSQVAETMLKRPHPRQGFHSCLGLRRLAKDYGEERLEGACRRAITINGASYKSLRSILHRGLDQHDLKEKVCESLPSSHENVRGAAYYQTGES